MNRNKLKTYAPAARRDFLQSVKDRATHYGLSAKKIEPMTERGDVVLIAGQPFPKSVATKRRMLEQRIERDGYDRTIEAVAYTWFNRFVAIRFMELHGYLDHGYRVLSHPGGGVQPEILDHAQRVEFPGMAKEKVLELKLDGTKQEELYRLLLVAQCNALNKAMPFLFEKIEDETELLLPANLLATDSLIRKLVEEVDEADWQEVEILGWLYQFYISERKDEVIGKVVASEDIPAATQLFTPNWIVKYLVQNTLGRIWLASYPQSAIRQQMEFYIEPAEQTPEVQEQLKAITPTSLNPEELTLLDPACGSAHILVEAYDLFKAIYQERGYRAKDIPGLILQKNLYGLEIDDRAAQLAAFALLMKARADDRRVFESGVQPNVLAFVESKGMDAGAITHALNSPIDGGAEGTVAKADIATLIELFEHAKTFGSLIQIPADLTEKLPAVEKRLAEVLAAGDLTHAQTGVIVPVLRQARLLARQYEAVVANPPYMGGKYFGGTLKHFVSTQYKESKADLYACFMQRSAGLARTNGFVGMITIPNWMFLTDFKAMRHSVLTKQTIDSLIHNGRGVFGSDFGSCSFVIRNCGIIAYQGVFRRLFERQGSVADNDELKERFFGSQSLTSTNQHFLQIPGAPVAYWASESVRAAFAYGKALGSLASPKIGMRTGDNGTFLRLWHEVSVELIGFDCDSAKEAVASRRKWFPYNKGGDYRKWYGNNWFVVNWQDDGHEIKQATRKAYPQLGDNLGWKISNEPFYFQPCITWTATSSSFFGVRFSDKGFLFDVKGSCCFGSGELLPVALSLLTTKQVALFLSFLNPSIEFQTVDLARIPVHSSLLESNDQREAIARLAADCIRIARTDWDTRETSWGFLSLSVVQGSTLTLRQSQEAADQESRRRFFELRDLEERNNRLFIDIYGLQDDLTPEVPDEQITLYSPDREEDIKRLLSYAVGCMMGRFSLDKEGLVYAHAGNAGFDPSQYKTFPADDDGIVPVTEAPWFDDDAANRFERFVKTVWPTETLEENLAFVAESLGAKKSETPRETMRRYFASDFYKHHLQTYKNRPIYWLFSSGKQGAFEAVVYLHRYNEGTLARMRTEYVVPLLGKISGRIGMLADTIASATSTKQRKDAEKEKDKLTKQQAELQAFDEKLRHYADQRITLDLDDGVKVNYGKFGDLLADVKKVCGKDEE
jgi:hypothetical protein